MFKVIHPNRWLMWAISIIFIVFIFTWGQVKLFAAELDAVTAVDSVDLEQPHLGSLAWKSGDAGQLYTSDKSSLREVTYPSKWISKEKDSRLYFSNRGHQCALIVADAVPPVGSYALVEEKTVTTDKGDVKLNIFKNESLGNDQKYLVLPVSGELQKIEGSNVFGLIRVDDPALCVDTFGKILSTFKISKK